MQNWTSITSRLLLLLGLLFGAALQAQPSLTQNFAQLQECVDESIRAILARDYDRAADLALDLRSKAKALVEARAAVVGENNPNWEYFSSNLYNHANELIVALQQRDSFVAIHLLATMSDHVGELQATVPYWLRGHLFQLMADLERGLLNHDALLIRNAAEELHTSSTKILMSANTRRSAYLHTRWTGTISAINRLGDEIIPMSEQGHWEKIASNAAEIKILLQRWSESFVELSEHAQ